MEQLIALLLGAFASYLQGKSKLKNWQKLTIALVMSIIAGLVATFFPLIIVNGKITPELLWGNLGLSFAASQTFYNLYFKPLT